MALMVTIITITIYAIISKIENKEIEKRNESYSLQITVIEDVLKDKEILKL